MISVVFLLGCSALFSGLTIGILSLNHYELKRKAQLGDKAARVVYPIKSYGNQLVVTLLIGNVVVNSAIAILLNSQMNGLLALILTTFAVVLFAEIMPRAYLRNNSLEITAKLSPALRYLIAALSPVAKPLGQLLDKRVGAESPRIYSKEELFKILDEHKISPDSDIERDTIKIVRHALNFGDKHVREVMTPKRMVVSVSADDDIGPILIDELHKSGHSRFPVYNDKKAQNFVGTLYLHDLVGLKSSGKVSGIMRKETFYVHEEQLLDHALRAFLKNNHHLFVVVNTFEEFVGVLSIEDVIEEIIGKQIVDEFDQHTDLRAVAKSLAESEAKARAENEKK